MCAVGEVDGRSIAESVCPVLVVLLAVEGLAGRTSVGLSAFVGGLVAFDLVARVNEHVGPVAAVGGVGLIALAAAAAWVLTHGAPRVVRVGMSVLWAAAAAAELVVIAALTGFAEAQFPHLGWLGGALLAVVQRAAGA
jgi:hypothetical protein